MKFFSAVALIVLCFLNSVNAQDTIQKNKIYRTWISLNSQPFETQGILYEIKDSSILISSAVFTQDYSTFGSEIVKFQYNNIETIKIRRKKSVVKGILIGAVTGFAVGGVIGLASGDDPPCKSTSAWGSFCLYNHTTGEKAIGGGFSLAICGVGLGALIGSIKVKIPINGSINNYYKNKNKLKKYSFKK